MFQTQGCGGAPKQRPGRITAWPLCGKNPNAGHHLPAFHVGRERAGVASLVGAGWVSPATPAGQGHRLSTRELREAFKQQVSALVEGGVDLLLFETFGSLAEMVDAVSVASEWGDVPIVSLMTFVEDGRTLAGDTPEEIATTLEGLGVTAL